jgi:16S rRNA (guanine527-N7)-methyltransferase
VLDSAQLFPLLPPESRGLADFGSGAGFPGLILAIMGAESVHLVESDTRKAAFLREAARETGATVTVHAKRIEAILPFQTDVVTARALAPVDALLRMVYRFLSPGGVCLFPKGRNAEDELTAASGSWTMRVQRYDSVTDRSATILRLSHIARKPGLRRP